MKKIIKVAYLCVPYVGGTYTTFADLRSPLLKRGFDFRCIGLKESKTNRSYSEKLEEGVQLWHVPSDPAHATSKVIEMLLSEDYKLVIVIPHGRVLTSNLPRYLPKSIRTVILAVGMTYNLYNITKCMVPFVDSVIAISDRIHSDLINRFKIPVEKIVKIYNGVDINRFFPRIPVRGAQKTLRTIFLGRISDADKGVFFLPRIIKKAVQVYPNIVFDVVGSGPDEERLGMIVERLGVGEVIRFLGEVRYDEIPRLLGNYDCLLMPSRMEGFGLSLVEGMAAECVPVAHDIWGSISSIIEDGKTGFVVPIGDVSGFADRLVQLAKNRDLLLKMGRSARRSVSDRFSVEKQADKYAELFMKIVESESQRLEPLFVSNYRVPRVLHRNLRSYLPTPIKKLLRSMLVRMGVSV